MNQVYAFSILHPSYLPQRGCVFFGGDPQQWKFSCWCSFKATQKRVPTPKRDEPQPRPPRCFPSALPPLQLLRHESNAPQLLLEVLLLLCRLAISIMIYAFHECLSTVICIYIYIYVHIYIYTYTCIYIYIYIRNIYTLTCTFVYIYIIYKCVCVYTGMPMSM